MVNTGEQGTNLFGQTTPTILLNKETIFKVGNNSSCNVHILNICTVYRTFISYSFNHKIVSKRPI